MEKYYTISEVATMTGLTTRTLRTYLKANMLNGEKIDGVWRFTEENFSEFIANPNIKPSIQAKNKAIIYDFLAQNDKKLNEICSIIDLYVDTEEAEEISAFFCNTINSYDAGGIRFSFEREGKNVRVILRGHEDAVMDILNAYYHR